MAVVPSSRSRAVLVRWLCAVVVVLVVIQNAWVCDDAFITLRVVDHAWAGRGLVFNEGWRVQAYTHPAWLAVLAAAYGVLGSGFWAALVCGVGTTAAALWLGLVRIARGHAAVLVAVTLVGSRAFIDYSTSGLENPLVHLVLAMAAWVYLGQVHRRRAFTRIVGLVGLAFLCRPDAPLLLVPLALAVGWQARQHGASLRALVRAAALGLVPVLAWELFSLVYYGSLVPNTALAKLGAGLPRHELWIQGGRYLLDAALGDRVTAVGVVVGAALCWARRQTRPFALGAVLHLLYVVWIGGDFMAGRFLTAPLWLVALGVARRRVGSRITMVASVGLVAMSLLGARSPLLTGPGSVEAEPPRPSHGIADERAHYAAAASVWAWSPTTSLPRHHWRELGEAGPDDGSRVVVFNTMGYYGFFADPGLHVVDGFALGDPLLARLPAVRRLSWRPGHLARPLPDGYLDALGHDDSSYIEDPAVRELYEALELVHRGPLWSGARWAAIWGLHTGVHTAAIDRERYHFFETKRVQAQRVLRGHEALRIRDAGLRIEGLVAGQALELVIEPPLPVELRWLAGDDIVATEGQPAAERSTVTVRTGADGLHVVPMEMGGQRSVSIVVSGRSDAADGGR
jgi:arabinofuranosyltransferase